jgi:hypothetical protein
LGQKVADFAENNALYAQHCNERNSNNVRCDREPSEHHRGLKKAPKWYLALNNARNPNPNPNPYPALWSSGSFRQLQLHSVQQRMEDLHVYTCSINMDVYISCAQSIHVSPGIAEARLNMYAMESIPKLTRRFALEEVALESHVRSPSVLSTPCNSS